jgi:hypothetical protein
MLPFLADRAGEPVFWNFALRCCRRLEALRTCEAGRSALGRLEALAAGRAGAPADALAAAQSASAWAALAAATTGPAAQACAMAAVFSALVGEDCHAVQAGARVLLAGFPGPPDRGRIEAERLAQADLLRSLCHPFPARATRQAGGA